MLCPFKKKKKKKKEQKKEKKNKERVWGQTKCLVKKYLIGFKMNLSAFRSILTITVEKSGYVATRKV